MDAICKFILAAVLALAVQPAFAQAPITPMPPGAQNPAVAQPRLVAPPPMLTQPGPQPTAQPAGPQPGSPSALIVPGGAGGLCECLNSHNLSAAAFDKTHLHQSCLGSVDACQAACNTQYLFSFVPHAPFTCPGRPGEELGKVAVNARPSVLLLSQR
jgi:hypothetical protein